MHPNSKGSQAPRPDRPPDSKTIAGWLGLFVKPGDIVEVRAIEVVDNPRYPSFTVAGYFDSEHLIDVARACLEWTDKAEGVYFTVNPPRSDLLARSANRVKRKLKNTTSDAEIDRRTDFYLDADPVRPAGVSSTDDEKTLAWERINAVVEFATGLGFPPPILADSGNGFHAHYRIDLPADDGGLIERVLKAADALFSTDRVKIDAKVFNPSRVVKLYGSIARKGDPTPERPHRRSQVLSVPDEVHVVPRELLEAFAAKLPAPAATAEPESPPAKGETHADVEARARAYLGTIEGAVSGQNGHDKAFYAACKIGPGFNLPENITLEMIRTDYNPRCDPPWSEKDLAHKVKDAYKRETRRGWLLGDQPTRRSSPPVSANGNGLHHPADKGPDDDTEVVDYWPAIRPEAYHGLAGEIVELVDEHTEADPAAILVQFLVAFSNMAGRSPYFLVSGTRHYLNLFVALVGATAVGRKGTSWDVVTWLLRLLDPVWADSRIQSGLVSGEGLIHHVRDATSVEKNGETIVTDPGVTDKRLLIVETELSRTLKAMARDHNTLSDVLRQGWDHGKLRTLGKNSPVAATDAFISIIAHVTQADIRRHLTETDSANGFANRFLWPVVRRSKILPEGGELDRVNWTPIVAKLREIAGSIGDHRMRRDATAGKVWGDIYEPLSAGKPGLLGMVLSRAEAQVMRLACIYALLDSAPEVRAQHLVSAVALWDYCEASARFVFGDSLGDPDAEKLLNALREAPDGLKRKEINVDVFNRHKKSGDIVKLLSGLLTGGLIHRVALPSTGGRPTEVWHAGRDPKSVRTKAN